MHRHRRKLTTLLIGLMILALTATGTGTLRRWLLLKSEAMPPSRLGYSLTNVDGEIYLFGGVRGVPLNDLWRWNREERTWTKLEPAHAPPARGFHEAVVHDAKLVVFFGLGARRGRLADAWSYDPAANLWEEVEFEGPMPSGRAFHAAAVLKGKLWMLGGASQEGLDNELWSFDFASSTWENHAAVPGLGLAGHSMWAHDDKLFVFGGQFGEPGGTRDSLVNVVMPDRGVSEEGEEEEEESHQAYPSDDSSGSGDGRGLVNVVMPDRGVSSDGTEEEEEELAYPSEDSTGGGDGHGLVNVVMPDRGVSSGDEEEEEESLQEQPSDDSTGTEAGLGLVNVVMPDRGVGQLWIYDTQTGAWDQTTPAEGGPSDRDLHVSVGSDSSMWVFGGRDEAGNPLSDAWEYNPDSDAWTPMENLPVAGFGGDGVWCSDCVSAP